MTKGCSGKEIHTTFIETSVGPLHDLNNQLMISISQEQSMVYSDCDAGLFLLSVDDRHARRNDLMEAIPTDKQKQVKLKKSELVDLQMATDLGQGIGCHALLNMRVVELQNKANAFSIDIETVLTTKLLKGWVGKRKGLLQVLWEKGFIDETAEKNRMKVLDGMAIL
jgi:hypothetical protein